jgi:hypothetical protein
VHGTIYEEGEGRLVRVIDRTGAVHAELTWSGASGQLDSLDSLVRLIVTGAVVHGAVIRHPLLGAAHAVGDTAMTALAWARPTEIPALAEPGRLPLGAGGAILNTIAVLAQRAGVPRLRYAGPYPTPALWRTLARSFRCDADEAAFTAGTVDRLLDRALRVARDPIAIDFVPAPNERIAIAGGFVELRDHLERAVIDGVTYEPGGSPARLVEAGGDHHVEIWFGDAPYARVATLTPDGALVAGPHAIPPCESPVIGRAFPRALRVAIAELVADAVPAPLAAAARTLGAAQALRWADLGACAAREQPDGFAVHAALWDRIAPLGLDRLALALAEALAPVVTWAVVRRASQGAPVPRATVGPPSAKEPA